MTFTVKIDSDNDAMQLPEHVVDALGRVAAEVIFNLGLHPDPDAVTGGKIRDANGNTVGEWTWKGQSDGSQG